MSDAKNAIVVKPVEQTESAQQATHRLYRPEIARLKGGKVTISKGLTWVLKLHAKRWRPAESCAMLFGYKDDKNKTFDVRGAVLCSNPTHSPGYFEIPPIELIRCFEIAQSHKMEIIGVYHSHPSGFEIPSTTDHHYMAITPGAWIIYSWTAYRCYTLKKGRWGMNVKELDIDHVFTEDKPIIEYAFDWKTTKFPPKPKPFRWNNRAAMPVNYNDKIPRVNWPPDWGDDGLGPYM